VRRALPDRGQQCGGEVPGETGGASVGGGPHTSFHTFSNQGVLADIATSGSGLETRLRNMETAATAVAGVGWKPLLPAPDLRSGILLLQAVPTMRRLVKPSPYARLVRSGFPGVVAYCAATCYRPLLAGLTARYRAARSTKTAAAVGPPIPDRFGLNTVRVGILPETHRTVATPSQSVLTKPRNPDGVSAK